jgi:hypothetical protein
MKLEVGKKYKCRNGDTVFINQKLEDNNFPFCGASGKSYTENGSYLMPVCGLTEENPWDILEEVKEEPAQRQGELGSIKEVLEKQSKELGEAQQIELPAKGKKSDSQKPRYSLLVPEFIWGMVEVMEFGAKKYSVDNWKLVPDMRTRYYDAAMRHINSWWTGEKVDPETGKSHLLHAACCLMFLFWRDE